MDELLHEELPAESFWIEPRVLPFGGKMILAGNSKLGKSFCTLSIARALTLGESPFGQDSGLWVPKPARVLMVDCELGKHRLQENARHVFKGRENSFKNMFGYVSKIPQVQLDTVDGQQLLAGYIRQFKPEILILDPIGKLHSKDESDNQAVNTLFTTMDKLLALGAAWNMALIITHHSKKPPSDSKYAAQYDELDVNNALRGGAKWHNDPDAIVTIGNRASLNSSPHASWRINARWMLRHGPELEEMVLSVNQQNDRRVRFLANASGAVPAGKTKVTNPPGGGLPVLTGH